jgi:hypothetical protein
MVHPLQLLFDIPLDEARLLLRDLITAAPDLVLADNADAGAQSMTVLKGGLGLSMTWSAGPLCLRGFRALFLAGEPERTLAVLAIGLDRHVDGGARVPVLAKELLALGARIADQLPVTAVAWLPARLVSAPAFFVENVLAYEQGGIFPVLPTIDLECAEQDVRVCSHGLSWFSGQEIEIAGDNLAHGDLMRRAVRLAHDIATNGPVGAAQQVPDIDGDKLISLVPDVEGAKLVCTVQPTIMVASAL